MANHDDFDALIAARQHELHNQEERERKGEAARVQDGIRAIAYGQYAAQLLVAAGVKPSSRVIQLRRSLFRGWVKSSQLGEGWDLGSIDESFLRTGTASDYPERGSSIGYTLGPDGGLRTYRQPNDFYSDVLLSFISYSWVAFFVWKSKAT